MTQGSDVLTLIDGAITDWTTSGDAMRWQREAPALVAQPPPEVIVRVRFAMDEFTASWVRVQRELMEAFRSVGEQVLRMAPQIKELNEALDPTDAATRGAASPRVPRYRDQRPRWQSPYGPRKAR